MRALGYLLITAGFLAGSVVAVQTEENHIAWGWFLPSFAVGVVGVGVAVGVVVLAVVAVVLVRVPDRRIEGRRQYGEAGQFAEPECDRQGRPDPTGQKERPKSNSQDLRADIFASRAARSFAAACVQPSPPCLAAHPAPVPVARMAPSAAAALPSVKKIERDVL